MDKDKLIERINLLRQTIVKNETEINQAIHGFNALKGHLAEAEHWLAELNSPESSSAEVVEE